MSFTPSIYQEAVFNFIQNEAGSAVVQAVAGSGKTTTIVQALKLIPQNESILMLAFNKSIAEELSSRVPSHVVVSTFHSCAFRAYSSSASGKVMVDDSKVYKALQDNLSEEEFPVYSALVKRLVDLGKSAGVSVLEEDSLDTWMSLIERFDMDITEVDPEYLCWLASQTLSFSNKQKNVVDFNDMMLFPLIYTSNFKKYDWVFIDEAQDTNAVQRVLLRKLLKPNGRLVAVGDSCQAIYGFRGADSSALNLIKEEFGAKELPLSISYRCPKAVVEHAKNWVTHIEASETAINGSVSRLEKYNFSIFNNKDAILCRNVAPLVEFAYTLMSNEIPVNFIGRDIGKGLISFIKKFKAKDLDTLSEKMSSWVDKEVLKFKAKGEDSKADSLNDKYNCVCVFMSQMIDDRTVSGLIAKIESLFSDKKNNLLTLSTCHKSKGLEFPRVFILNDHLFFPKWAKKEWMREQEKNLVYVAVTRAKEDLIYINSENLAD